MMRAVRFPIAGMMAAVLIVALGLAAVRNASPTWASVTFLSTCAVLCLAIVGIICRGETERAWWLGFALFGWGYLLLAFWSSIELPTMVLLDAVGSRLGAKVRFSGGMGGMGGGMGSAGLQFGNIMGGGSAGIQDPSFQQIAHCLWALVAALLGGVLAATFFGGPRKGAEKLDTHTQLAAESAGPWWLSPAVLWLAGCVVIVFLGVLGARSAHGHWAGAAFFTTCAVLGIGVLSAASAKGKRRQVGLGAALFGVGYLTLALGLSHESGYWPILPTDHLLAAVRPWFPPGISGFPTTSDGVVAANARIMAALEQPVPMRFPDETPLEDIVKYIKAAATGPDGKTIPIYVDPIGLQEADKNTNSTMVIDLEGVALKTSLRLCLAQLDLAYNIRDGVLLITSEESAVTPVYQDPFLITGHCLLALLAAGLGGIAAPLVSGTPRKPPARDASQKT
jgi:hypothetical protein